MITLAKLGLTRQTVCIGLAKTMKARVGRRGLPPTVIEAMHEDYRRLKSLSQVGKLYGRSRQSMYTLFKERGLPLNPRNFQPKIIWNGQDYTMRRDGYYRATTGCRRPLHHVIWEQTTGRAIPEGWQVSFKDADSYNVKPENLFCAPIVEVTLYHQRRHHPSARLTPEERRRRRLEYGRDYMRKKTAANIARGLRCDGKPRRDPIFGKPWRDPKPDRPPRQREPELSQYEKMKQQLGIQR